MKTKKTILHVDDDQAMLDLVSRSLQNRGYEVVSVVDPTKALEALVDCAARIVILDIDMPNVDGLTLLREIKQRDAGIHVVMLTGLVSMGTILKATSLGAQECVFKPIKDLKDIGEAVDRCFNNIESWWAALREWMERKNEAAAFTASDIIPLAKETIPAGQVLTRV
jgi:DNA-binding NtrC family response regulator